MVFQALASVGTPSWGEALKPEPESRFKLSEWAAVLNALERTCLIVFCKPDLLVIFHWLNNYTNDHCICFCCVDRRITLLLKSKSSGS